MSAELLLRETVFLNRSLYQEAERHYALRSTAVAATSAASVKSEVSKIREQIRSGLGDESVKVADLVQRLSEVELENKALRATLQQLEARLAKLDGQAAAAPAKAAPVAAAAAPAAAKPAAKPAKDDDDDMDLFDDDEDDEAAARLKEERIKAYADKKAKKPALIAKSSVLLDVKPWDDETDMKALEASVRTIQMEGLIWGTGKLVPVAFGVKKLQIQCVIEDDKVSTEALEEAICAFEDFVQSVDIAAFNKI